MVVAPPGELHRTQQAAVVAVHAVEESQTLAWTARVDVATFQYQSTTISLSLSPVSMFIILCCGTDQQTGARTTVTYTDVTKIILVLVLLIVIARTWLSASRSSI